jgi:hypothetical protein
MMTSWVEQTVPCWDLAKDLAIRLDSHSAMLTDLAFQRVKSTVHSIRKAFL